MYKRFWYCLLLLIFVCSYGQQPVPQMQEVIYGRRDGMALTMFVQKPNVANNRAVVYVMSGGYYSDARWLPDYAKRAQEFINRGYTVFYVLHASAPMYSAPETIADVQAAVQFVRFHADEYHIDPNKIAATGSSSGGNLSLLIGTTDAANTSSTDQLKRTSSKVNAVACFFPPTDFLNFRSQDNYALTDSLTQKLVRESWIVSAFMFKNLNKSNNTYQLVPDDEKTELYRALSPIYGVDKSTAPTYIIHGDQDKLVPLYQSQRFIGKLKQAGVSAELDIRQGAGHGWDDTQNDFKAFADWFDLHLR
jgi:acetyl esterase/lipase